MKIVHVEKRPYPNGDYTTTHWSMEVDPSDLGLKEPTSPNEAVELSTKLMAFAKYMTLNAMVSEGVISIQEFWVLISNFIPALQKLGFIGEKEQPTASEFRNGGK